MRLSYGMSFNKMLLVACACLVLSSGILEAQSLDNVTRRKLNLAVLNSLDDYQLASAINSKSDRYRFVQLFESPENSVFCDLYNSGDLYRSQVTVTQYADLLMSKCENVNAEISSVRKGNYFCDEESVWHCKVALDKTLTYNDVNGVLFPPFSYSVPPFHLVIDFVYDSAAEKAKIRSIDCLNAVEDFVEMKDYYIVQRNREKKDSLRDCQVTIARNPLEFNSFGQAYAKKGRIEYWDYDVKVGKKVLAEDDLYELIVLNYKRKNFRVKARYGMTYGSRYDIRSSSDFSDCASTGKEAGVDFGFSFSCSRRFRVGFYTGVAASYSTLDLAQSNISYAYQTTDNLGVSYSRSYTLNSVTQDLKFMDISVPLYMNLNFRVARGLSLYFDAGAKAYFNMLAEVSPMKIDGSVIQSYKDRKDVQNINVSTNEFLSPKAFERQKMDYAVFGNAGLEICLAKNSVYLLASAGYEYGLTWVYASNENAFSDSTHFPYVYDAAYGRDVVFRPFADCLSFRRESIWLNFGLMLKL